MEEVRGFGKASWAGHCRTYFCVAVKKIPDRGNGWEGRHFVHWFLRVFNHTQPYSMMENLSWGRDVRQSPFTRWRPKKQRTRLKLGAGLPPSEAHLWHPFLQLVPISSGSTDSQILPHIGKHASQVSESGCIPPRSLNSWIMCASKTSTIWTKPRVAAILRSNLAVLERDVSLLGRPVSTAQGSKGIHNRLVLWLLYLRWVGKNDISTLSWCFPSLFSILLCSSYCILFFP